jgi:propanediol dehydratase large subunit
MNKLNRFRVRDERPLHREEFIEEWPEAGLIITDSPADPKPSLRLEHGRVVELDCRAKADFDLIDRFIAGHAIDLDVAEVAMRTDSLALARMAVDIHTSRQELSRLIGGCTPAKLVDILRHLNTVEMMAALQKMRLRRRPENQAHVTNRKDNPALLAADAAEAALRGFAEEETTTGVARYAPLNAIAILVGSQAGRGGVLTQCAVEESLGLQLALKGLTSYAETLSVYGSERAFIDGDDTPWSKAFLAAAYASRGIKVRFTSGSGSESLMGHAEGKSMLYLEARCLMVVKGAGSQGVQNGSVSLIALPMSLPGGVWGVLAENLLAAMLGLEVASGNDAVASHSTIRKSAKLMLQFLPGTDFVTSGYSAVPRADNMFGGGNFDSDDLDDWAVLQRDMMVDGGIRAIAEAGVIAARRRGACAVQAVFAGLGLPPVTDEEVEMAVTAYDSDSLPDRDRPSDLAAAERLLSGSASAVDVILALSRRGFYDIAQHVLELQRQRVIGDHLQPSAVFDSDFQVQSALNDPNDYCGPGTGYRLRGSRRWKTIRKLPWARDPRRMLQGSAPQEPFLREVGEALSGDRAEVVIGVGPAFGATIDRTICGLSHRQVLQALIEGVSSVGVPVRMVKIYNTSDCGLIGHTAAQLSGSGIGIGLQSKGTAVIHSKQLAPLNNLELFPMAPTLTLETYRAIGRNAAGYALHEPVEPVSHIVDNTARLRWIVNTALLHILETQEVRPGRPPVELELGSPSDVS